MNNPEKSHPKNIYIKFIKKKWGYIPKNKYIKFHTSPLPPPPKKKKCSANEAMVHFYKNINILRIKFLVFGSH